MKTEYKVLRNDSSADMEVFDNETDARHDADSISGGKDTVQIMLVIDEIYCGYIFEYKPVATS